MFDSTDTIRWGTAHRHFLSHLVTMPGWHKLVIVLGGLVAVAGTAGRVATAKPADSAPQVSSPVPRPTGSSGFAADAPATPTPKAAAPQPTGFLSQISPHMQGVGLSVVLGFIIGWFFRAFLKTMALLMFLVFGGLWLLSHYHILNVSAQNLDAMKSKSGEAVGWLSAQATAVKDFAIAHLPSSGGGAFGAFLGLRRR
jgi:uncharacterized membrane protein (Fun14 family)